MKFSRVALLLGLTALLGLEDFFVMAQDLDDFDDDLDDDYDELKKDYGSEPPESAESKLGSLPSVPFRSPSVAGLHWVETFEGDWSSRWSRSASEKFSGRWEQSVRKQQAITGDHALAVKDEARHHGIASKFPTIENNEGGNFIISYEAKFENGLQCGGAYLKLFDASNLSDMSEFNNETPYVIMFGPDRCGSTNKVHFIFKIRNPVSGEWTEHHLNSPPMVPSQDVTHLYTLIIKPDDTFVVEVDGIEARSGSLFEEFSPPLQAPEEIPDPTDEKPDDWVDAAKIPDPDAVKPDDWDEDAPAEIEDPSATKPDDWLEDEPKLIADPDASIPEDWDPEEDGEWQAPLVANPRCAEAKGCGPWSPPMLQNPDYKGKWKAPMIDNPAYIGPWKRKQMANPNYFKLEKPHRMYRLNAVGYELWTMQSRLLFDNVAISRDIDAHRRFTDSTFKVRSEIELSWSDQPKAPEPFDNDTPMLGKLQNALRWAITEYPVPAAAVVILTLVMSIMMAMRRGKAAPKPKTEEKAEASSSGKPAASSSSSSSSEKKDDKATARQRSSTKPAKDD